MSDLGVEEGCPAEEPADLEEIIRRPVKRPQPVAAPTYVLSFSLLFTTNRLFVEVLHFD